MELPSGWIVIVITSAVFCSKARVLAGAPVINFVVA